MQSQKERLISKAVRILQNGLNLPVDLYIHLSLAGVDAQALVNKYSK